MIMPMGDEDFEHDDHKMHHGISKAEQRRSNKPIMEKKRRARINHCLNELKSLILDAMKKDPARHSKLEKADILEMTVKHLQSVQRQQLAVAVATDPAVLHKFKSGFNECAGEVSRYIGHLDGVEIGVKQRLVNHLANCVTGLQQLSPFAFGNANLFPGGVPQDLNNNQRVQGVQLIPSRLPTGELALLVPNSGNMASFFPTSTRDLPSSTVTSATLERTHASAFTAVNRCSESQQKSPPLSPTSSSSDESDYQISTSKPYVDHHRMSPPPCHPQPPGFKVPLRSPSGFTAFQEHKSPPQHSAVSSTCLPAELRSPDVQTYAHVKLEFKSVPISRDLSMPSIPLQQPLSVVTSHVYNIPSDDHARNKNPLDFSFKKDIIRQSASTQTPTTNKRPHYDTGSQSHELITSSIISPNKVPRYQSQHNLVPAMRGNEIFVQDRPSSGQQSTAAAESAEDKDMWRPW